MNLEPGHAQPAAADLRAADLSLTVARLTAKLESLPVIEQAKGILMAQQRCGPEEAFDLLRRASQQRNVPVRDLAAQLVASTARNQRPGQDTPISDHRIGPGSDHDPMSMKARA